MKNLKEKPETPIENPEIFQQNPEKTPENTPETPESPITANNINQALILRNSGRTYAEISSVTGISAASLSRIFKGVSDQKNNGDSNPAVAPAATTPEAFDQRNIFAPEPAAPSIPSGYTAEPAISAEKWEKYSKYSKNRLLSELCQREAENQQLKFGMGRGNDSVAYAHNNSSSGEEALFSELAKTEKLKRTLLIADRDSNTKKSGDYDIKSVIELLKFLSPERADELSIYKQASEDTRKNLESMMKRGESNDFDVKLEELRQNREVDLKKLDWEIEQYRANRAEDSRKWEILAGLASGPIGDAVKSLGVAGANRITKKQPKVGKIVCPSCQRETFVDESADVAVCGACGVSLARQKSIEAPPEGVQEENVTAQETTEQKEGNGKNE